MASFLKLCSVVGICFVVYFFSFQIQKVLGMIATAFSKRVGTWSVTQEYALQRYIFIHPTSLVARLYNWINEQIIALSFKRYGITPVGYSVFWCFIALVLDIIILQLLSLQIGFVVPLFFVMVIVMFTCTRVFVSNRIIRREADIMDAVDLIIPDIGQGVQNAIMKYLDNFAPAIQGDFRAFISNITDRGYTFNDAMYILAESMGVVFKDFAQKAIFFEAQGERDMLEIFADIIETNRLRRELRQENEAVFTEVFVSFAVSAAIVVVFAVYMITTDAFTYHFFFQTTWGKVLLLIMIGIIFAVLSFITTLKSKAL